MSRRRRRSGGNPDRNQGPLIDMARDLGATVVITSQIGGWVDATVGFRGQNLLWEVKQPGWKAALGRRKKLTKSEQGQMDLRATWAGKIEVIETADDVLRSLLQADKNRPLDYQGVPDDFLAAVCKALALGETAPGKANLRLWR